MGAVAGEVPQDHVQVFEEPEPVVDIGDGGLLLRVELLGRGEDGEVVESAALLPAELFNTDVNGAPDAGMMRFDRKAVGELIDAGATELFEYRLCSMMSDEGTADRHG